MRYEIVSDAEAVTFDELSFGDFFRPNGHRDLFPGTVYMKLACHYSRGFTAVDMASGELVLVGTAHHVTRLKPASVCGNSIQFA